MGIQARKNFLINISFTAVTVILFYIFGKLLFYFLPFVAAAVSAWIVQKPADRISARLKIKSGTAACVLAALLYILIAAAVTFVIYGVYSASQKALGELPELTDSFTRLISGAQKKLSSALSGISPDAERQINLLLTDMLDRLLNAAGGFFSSSAAKIAKGTPSFLINSIITLVAGCFIAKDFKGLSKFAFSIFGKKTYSNILKVKNIFCDSVSGLFKGYFLIMLLTFAELTVGFWISGIKYAPLLALIIALIDILPVLGTGAVLIPWAITDFIIGNTKIAVCVSVIYAVVTLVRNFVEPKIIGDKIGIDPLITLFAMFVGIKIFGFSGIFILPIALIVTVKYYKSEMEEENSAERQSH